MEAAVAAILFALGALVMFDSARIGARWADDGPQAGYFPFYIGLILCTVSAVTLFTSLRRPLARAHSFVSMGQLRLILKLLAPFAVFVVAIKPLGIYVASAIFIAYFMLRMGDFPRWMSIVVPIGTVAALFLMFERWFTVSLPKGPLESMLGLG
jgi:putative tricarboxylic transport membrane protein